MAYQVNRSNSKGGVELSVGRNPAAQINRTEPPDEVSRVRSPTNAGYGENGPQNGIAQSVRPGNRVVSRLGQKWRTTKCSPG